MDLQNLRKITKNQEYDDFSPVFCQQILQFRKFCKNRQNSRFSRGPRIFQFQQKFRDFSNFPQILQLRANLHIRNSAKYSSNKTSHTHSEPFFLYLQFNNSFLFSPPPSFTQRQVSIGTPSL